LKPTEYSKNINSYGRLKLCLQPDVSVTTNRSRRFKYPDVTVTANSAEGLNMRVCALVIYIKRILEQSDMERHALTR
jgi:hypothetical protein